MRVVFGAGEAGIQIGYRIGARAYCWKMTIPPARVPGRPSGTEAFGFTFEEKERRPFVEKAEALGVPAGRIRRDW